MKKYSLAVTRKNGAVGEYRKGRNWKKKRK